MYLFDWSLWRNDESWSPSGVISYRRAYISEKKSGWYDGKTARDCMTPLAGVYGTGQDTEKKIKQKCRWSKGTIGKYRGVPHLVYDRNDSLTVRLLSLFRLQPRSVPLPLRLSLSVSPKSVSGPHDVIPPKRSYISNV